MTRLCLLKPAVGDELFSVQPQAATNLSSVRSTPALGNPFDPIALGFTVIDAVRRGSETVAEARAAGDYQQKELPEVTLATGAEAHGFVYFRPSEGAPAFDEAVLKVRVVDLAALRTNVLSLPLNGLNFRGWKH